MQPSAEQQLQQQQQPLQLMRYLLLQLMLTATYDQAQSARYVATVSDRTTSCPSFDY